MSRRGRETFARYRSALFAIARVLRCLPIHSRIRLLEVTRAWTGRRGLAWRYCLVKAICPECGDNVAVHPGSYLLRPERLLLGSNISIHPMVYIEAEGGVRIGDDVSIAHGATILSTAHGFDDPSVPIKDQPLRVAETRIENDVWIGAKATILAGLTIGSGAVVGAGAVVTRDVASGAVVVGVPARQSASRF